MDQEILTTGSKSFLLEMQFLLKMIHLKIRFAFYYLLFDWKLNHSYIIVLGT